MCVGMPQSVESGGKEAGASHVWDSPKLTVSSLPEVYSLWDMSAAKSVASDPQALVTAVNVYMQRPFAWQLRKAMGTK